MAVRLQVVRDPYKEINDRLREQKYHLIGSHSAVKKCLWTHKAVLEGKFCYKGKFYGIESHRCIQSSVSTQWCWNACMHCWRLRPTDMLDEWDEKGLVSIDDPRFIVEMSILEHKRTISGYRAFGVSDEVVREAMDPRHVAISLTGENTLYPRLGELIKEYHRRGITTFLVTRAVRPDILANLDEEPSQLYISLETYDEEGYEFFTAPLVANAWRLTMEAIEMLPSFTCPTVYRITAVKGWNMDEKAVKGFAKLVEIGMPTFIEIKAYMHVGTSITRLTRDNMPTHEEVLKFAEELARETGYKLVSQNRPSRVALLSILDKPLIRHGGARISWWDPDYEGEDEYQAVYGAIATK